MKVPLSWLAQYVPITLTPEQLKWQMTMSIAEVEEIVPTVPLDDKVRVGEVLEVAPHPNADRLRLVTVNLGDRLQQVVCGAPNVAKGQKIAFGELGARLTNGKTGETMVLEANKIRGVLSAGMVLSDREMGLSEDHEGIRVLPDNAPVGEPVRNIIGDLVIDLSSWANRPDLLSVLGVARDLAALTNQRVTPPEVRYAESGAPAADRLSVRIDDIDLCSRYTGMVIEGVTIGPSPAWMQERLAGAGMRPINNVVDITNYVMLEYGQPLHAFDYDKVEQHAIIVRRARAGEELVTLDGERRRLTPDMLVIADPSGPVALAGVMGGLDSEVSAATTTVLLEAATFYGPNIRRTSTRLRLRSEASARFEKGLPPELAEHAARRAAQLLEQLAGGRVAPGIVDAHPQPTPPVRFDVPAARLRQVLGIDLPSGRVLDVLTALGFEVAWNPPDRYTVGVPYWRPDVRIADDIAEELIRMVGYDDLPNTTIRGRLPGPLPQPARDLRERVKDVLAAAGMQEIQSYSLVNMEHLAKVVPPEELLLHPPIRVVNPLASQHEYLRTSVRGTALETLARNLRVRRTETALFETHTAFIPREGDLPEERELLVGVVGGRRADRWGQATDESVDFFDAKGYLDTLFEQLGVAVEWTATEEFGLLSGRTAALRAGGQDIGVCGQAHPDLARGFDIDVDAFLFEVRLDILLTKLPPAAGYRAYATLPAAEQDLSLLVDETVTAAELAAIIRQGRYVVAARPFSEFRGGNLPAGKKSITFAVTFQDPARTLTDDEVSGSRRRILAALEHRLGATLR